MTPSRINASGATRKVLGRKKVGQFFSWDYDGLRHGTRNIFFFCAEDGGMRKLREFGIKIKISRDCKKRIVTMFYSCITMCGGGKSLFSFSPRCFRSSIFVSSPCNSRGMFLEAPLLLFSILGGSRIDVDVRAKGPFPFPSHFKWALDPRSVDINVVPRRRRRLEQDDKTHQRFTSILEKYY